MNKRKQIFGLCTDTILMYSKSKYKDMSPAQALDHLLKSNKAIREYDRLNKWAGKEGICI